MSNRTDHAFSLTMGTIKLKLVEPFQHARCHVKSYESVSLKGTMGPRIKPKSTIRSNYDIQNQRTKQAAWRTYHAFSSPIITNLYMNRTHHPPARFRKPALPKYHPPSTTSYPRRYQPLHFHQAPEMDDQVGQCCLSVTGPFSLVPLCIYVGVHVESRYGAYRVMDLCGVRSMGLKDIGAVVVWGFAVMYCCTAKSLSMAKELCREYCACAPMGMINAKVWI